LPTDNPYLPDEYIDNLRSIKDKATRERLLSGNWEYDDDPSALIEFEAILDLWENDHVKVNDRDKWITADIALQGSDRLVLCVWYGGVLVDYVVRGKAVGKQIIADIQKLRKKHSIPPSRVIYDSDGVGGFIGGKNGFIPGARAFVNGAAPIKVKMPSGEIKKENYENLKTQCYYSLADTVNNAEIWLKALRNEKHREEVTEELEQVKSRDMEKDGKLKLIRKEEVKEVLGRSPDFADALMMREFINIMPRATRRKTKSI